jgi:uncharacterized protein YbaR (Trm112 family)
MLPDRKFLELLRCPVTRQPVAVLPKDRLRALNAAAAAGTLHYADGRAVTGSIDAALVTEDGTRAYAVRDGIPVMLAEECIDLGGVPEPSSAATPAGD